MSDDASVCLGHKTLVIAEPGCTHEGNLDAVLRLVDVTAASGADVFKAQWTSNAERMAQRRNAPEYLKYYKWLQFPIEWHETLRTRCDERGLQYGCSVYLPEDTVTVNPLVSMVKVSSFEASDVGMIAATEHTKHPVCVSVGLLESDQVRDVIHQWRMHLGVGVKLLQCSSAYPASASDINLAVLRRYGMDGLSDHSRHVLTGAVAVGTGAEIIEAHIRLDDTAPDNPDYAVAFSPREFAEYVHNIRLAETMMGDGEKRIQPSELKLLKYRVTG